jgi:hypothetical protein
MTFSIVCITYTHCTLRLATIDDIITQNKKLDRGAELIYADFVAGGWVPLVRVFVDDLNIFGPCAQSAELTEIVWKINNEASTTNALSFQQYIAAPRILLSTTRQHCGQLFLLAELRTVKISCIRSNSAAMQKSMLEIRQQKADAEYHFTLETLQTLNLNSPNSRKVLETAFVSYGYVRVHF